MKVLGKITNEGYLNTQIVQLETVRYTDSDGSIKTRTITEDEQAQALAAAGYKPVDDIDENKRVCDPGFYVRIVPRDSGDKIIFDYVTVKDKKYYQKQIDTLKKALADEDYKITKCYEASLLGLSLPYDIQALHQAREQLRSRVNALEAQRDKEE